ncbi:MAG TPA: hypothetical protein VNF24_10915 [Candidatus Acidoferrales bacterium]|nr:hypothetical protein [Candidatus Acidoferrales bacterium]
MADRAPLSHVVVAASSAAEDVGFVALSDMSAAVSMVGTTDDRLIGGHMVEFHVLRYELDLHRQTNDVDLGVPLAAVNQTLVAALERLGYSQLDGSRFTRQVDVAVAAYGPSMKAEAAIDILVPAYTSRPRLNRAVGPLVTTEVVGLADAINRPAVAIGVTARRLDGTILEFGCQLPDAPAALGLKVWAWVNRGEDRDAVDIWRMLEVCFTAGVTREELTIGRLPEAMGHLVRAGGKPDGSLVQAVARAQRLSPEGRRQRGTRIAALVRRIAPPV